MKKNNILLKLLIVIISVALVIFISMYVLDNTGKLNQGNFRVNDAMIKSSLLVSEVIDNEETINALTDIKLSANQENTLSLLLVSDVKPSRAYIDNVHITRANKGNVVIYDTQDKEMFSENINVEFSDISLKEQDGEYLLEVKINNMNIITNRAIPDGVNEVIYDGRLIKTYGIDVNDIKFNVSFNINIIDSNNKKNICKINLSLPNIDLVTNGVSITREPTSNYIFSVK